MERDEIRKVSWGQMFKVEAQFLRLVSFLRTVEFSAEAGGDRFLVGQCGGKETCEEKGNGLNYAAPVGWEEVDGFERLNKRQILISNLGSDTFKGQRARSYPCGLGWAFLKGS